MSTCMWKSQQLHDGSSSHHIQSLSFGPPADHIRQIYSLAPSCWALPKSCYCQRHFRAQIVVWPHSDHKQEAREQHKESFQAQRSHTQTNRRESALSTFSLCWDCSVMLLNIEQRNVLSCAINILIRFNRLWKSLFPRKPEIISVNVSNASVKVNCSLFLHKQRHQCQSTHLNHYLQKDCPSNGTMMWHCAVFTTEVRTYSRDKRHTVVNRRL